MTKAEKRAIADRAVWLDVRKEGLPSVWLIWDARTIHQGYTHMPGAAHDFAPVRVSPQIFAPEETRAWLEHLAEHGYAAVGPVVNDADVRRAVDLLERDVAGMLGQTSVSLGRITDEHLPNHANTGLRHRGLPHGEFAWFLRSHPAVLQLWRAVYPAQALVGCPALVALSPPHQKNALSESKSKKYRQFSTGEWLHLDYSPPLPDRMYQSTLYLFPPGCKWARIGIMTSMAPRAMQDEGTAAKLLAGAIIGAAGKVPAGVKFGHLQKVAEGYGTKGVSVLRPQVTPGLTDARVKELTGGRWSSVASLQRVALGAKPEADRVAQLVDLGLDVLRELAHPRCVQLICGETNASGKGE